MEERPIDGQRTIIAHHQSAVVAQPSKGALDDPASPVAAQGATVLLGGPDAVQPRRGDQLHAPPGQPLSQGVAVVAAVGNHALRLLPETARLMPSAYPHQRQRRPRQLDFVRGRRVKLVPQKKTLLPGFEIACSLW